MAEGSYYVNPYYASDAAGAQAAGMLVAPYEFAIPNYSGGALQADYALDHADYAPDGQIWRRSWTSRTTRTPAQRRTAAGPTSATG